MSEKEFIELIKKKRLIANIKSASIAKELCISKSCYSKIENHNQRLTFYEIIRLAELFDIDLNVLKNKEEIKHYYD